MNFTFFKIICNFIVDSLLLYPGAVLFFTFKDLASD